MKKLILTSAVLAAFVGANAQETPAGSGVAYKPTSGALAVELGLTGGLLNTATNLSSSGNAFPAMLKVRYFLSDDLALRASFNFSSNSRTDKAYKLDDDGKETSDVGIQKVKSSFYGINIGVEKHFTGTERLSTYIGADLSLGAAGASLKEEKYTGGNYSENNSRKVKGSSVFGVADPDDDASRGGFGFGLRAVTGADYYIAKKLYLGAEAGWGFFSFKNSKIKAETTVPSGVNSSTTTTVENKSDGGAFSLTPQVVASVRIGFIF
jgi:hypothetical protein